jgi:integrase
MARAKSAQWAGIRRRGAGWEANVRVGGHLHTQTFALDTPPRVMQDWRARQRGAAIPTRRGTLADDVTRYLATVRHMPTYEERKKHLDDWLAALGPDRSRATITTQELDAILSDWLTDPRSATDPRPLAPVSVRHRRTALRHLYRVLDGKSAPNPVADTRRPPDPRPQPRAVPLEHIRRMLEHLPTGQTRARVMVILATGLPHASVMALQPADVDLQRAVARVPARRKGQGAAARLLPLNPSAVAAFQEMARTKAWGAFSQSGMRSLVLRACEAAGVAPFTPYQLRHTAATLIYQQTGSLDTTARLLGHSTTAITQRYTQEAHLAVDTLAMAKVGRVLAAQLAPREKTQKKR